MKKASLGFATQKQAIEAVRAIVNRYGLNAEFFDPLLQRLFVEQPYWQSPPGPTFTKFKWIKQELPNGATTERWFMAYAPETGWVSRSLNKAIKQQRFNVDSRLREMARFIVMPIVSAFRDRHPFCEYCDPSMPMPTKHVHHTVAMKEIVDQALALLTDADRLEIAEAYYDWKSREQFQLPADHKFVRHILDRHSEPGLLEAVCIEHHNTVHGKATHVQPISDGADEPIEPED